MNNLELSEWAANQYLAYKEINTEKTEAQIVKYILVTRYKIVNVSEEFDELAIANLPSINTFIDLLICLLNIELKEGRTSELDFLIYSSFFHLRKGGYIERINSVDLQLINDCISNIYKYLDNRILDKEKLPMLFFADFRSLIISKNYKLFKSYNEVEAFLDMLIH
jgi:hypothetical protein